MVTYPASGKVRKKPITFPRNRTTPATKITTPSAITRVLISQCAPSDLLEHSLQELQSFDGDLIAGRLDATPDGRRARDDLHIGGERLDHHVALVTNGLEPRRNLFPINMIVARLPAIAAAGVEMARKFPGLAVPGPLNLSFVVIVEVVRFSLDTFVA